MLINALGRESLDGFFSTITLLGDGRFSVVFCLLMLFVSYKRWIQAILCLLIPSALTSLLKSLVFYEVVRPMLHFHALQQEFYSVEGVSLLLHHSFPSGHTTAAFAVFTYLALISKAAYLDLIYLLLAVLAGWSRIYLGQHFLVDVLAGALIGTLVSAIVFYLTDRALDAKRRSWLGRSIMPR